MLSNLFAAFNEMLYGLSQSLRMNFADYCELDSPINNEVMMTRDGALLSVLKIEGVQTTVPADTFRHIIKRLSAALSPSFQRNGLVLQFCFTNDPSPKTIDATLSKMMSESHKTIKTLNYGDGAVDLLNGQKDCLLDIVAIEKNFLLIWTTPAVLSDQERKENARLYKEKIKNAPNMGHGANPFLANKLMFSNHERNVQAVGHALLNCGIVVSRMTASSAIHEMRMGILVRPERDVNIVGGVLNQTDYAVSEHHMNATISMRERQMSRTKTQYDASMPRLNEFAKIDVEYAGNPNQVLVDGVYFQPTIMERPPTNIMFFNNLFSDLSTATVMGERIPYRILFTLSSANKSLLEFKFQLAQILRRTNIDTRALYEGAKQMREFINEQGVAVSLNVHMLTWGKTSDEANQRSSVFNTRMENWGSLRPNIKTGNPIEGFASASMGFSRTGIAQVSVPPLERALCLLPLARPTSLWESSPIIFRSLDGKPIPYVNMSEKMTYWVTFIAATMGAGKSVLANWLNTAFFLADNLTTLPYVSIIDFGFSSRGFIQVLKQFLPPQNAHMAVYKKIENSPNFCVNPHQLGLCLRLPKQSELEFLMNLYEQAMVDSSTGETLAGSREMIGMMLEECYHKYSDCYDNFAHATPKEYSAGVLPNVDRILKEHNFQIVDESLLKHLQALEMSRGEAPKSYRKTTWWEVTDFLCSIKSESGLDYIREAQMANRQATFTISDMLQIIRNTESLKNRYRDRLTKDGRSIIDEVSERIELFAKNYPIFAGITQFDVEDARAVSFDLENVVRKQPASISDYKHNSLMYMYALRVLTQPFFLVKEDLENDFPLPKGIIKPATMNLEWVYKYHYDYVYKISRAKKRIMIDEFHYTGSSETLMRMLEGFMRVVRKRNMELMLISQRMSDFVFEGKDGKRGVDLLYFYSTCFILSTVTGKEAAFIKERLDIRDEGTMQALANEIRSPKQSPKTGGSLFACYKIGSAQFTQLLTNKLSNVCLWNFDTTVENMQMREAMINVCMNETEAINILSESFPPYQTLDYFRNMQNELHSQDQSNVDPYKALAEMLYKRYLQRKNYR